MIFGKSRGGKAIGLYAVADDEHADQLGGASGGKLPIGWEMRIVDRNIVRVAFDAEVFCTGDNYLREAVDGFDRRGTHRGRAALVKSNFAKAYHQAFFLGLYVNHVFFNFRGK